MPSSGTSKPPHNKVASTNHQVMGVRQPAFKKWALSRRLRVVIPDEPVVMCNELNKVGCRLADLDVKD